MVKCLNIGKYIGKPIYRSISSQEWHSLRCPDTQGHAFLMFLYSKYVFTPFIGSSCKSLAVNWGFFSATLIKHFIPLDDIVPFLQRPKRFLVKHICKLMNKAASHVSRNFYKVSTLTLWDAYVRKGQTVWKKKQNRDRGSKKLELLTSRQVCCWLSASDSRSTGAQCNENQRSNCPTGIQNWSLTPPQLIQYISVAFWRILKVLFRKRMLYTLFDLIFCNMSAVTSEYTASAKLDTEANTYIQGG